MILFFLILNWLEQIKKALTTAGRGQEEFSLLVKRLETRHITLFKQCLVGNLRMEKLLETAEFQKWFNPAAPEVEQPAAVRLRYIRHLACAKTGLDGDRLGNFQGNSKGCCLESQNLVYLLPTAALNASLRTPKLLRYGNGLAITLYGRRYLTEELLDSEIDDVQIEGMIYQRCWVNPDSLFNP